MQMCILLYYWANKMMMMMITAPEVRRMVWQQTGVDGEETRTAVARWSGYAGELHVSRLHYAQPRLGHVVITVTW